MNPNATEAGMDTAYATYTHVRDKVVEGISRLGTSGDVDSASDYWSEELSGFDYMLEASPRLIAKLRHHTFHLTGLKNYDYRSTQHNKRKRFEAKLRQLESADNAGLKIPESPVLGGFGHRLGGGLYNLDTLKYYECLIAMDKGGVLKPLREGAGRKVLLEIGGGWGGLAYQLKKTVPDSTYVIVDFPEVFLFSATYLLSAFPGSRSLIVSNPDDEKALAAGIKDYDFVFLPHRKFDGLWNQPVDLALNTVSFQEMTADQVDAYLARLKGTGTRSLYSLNRDRSPHNPQMTKVSSILAKHFKVAEVSVLDGSYLELGAMRNRGLLSRAKRAVKGLLRPKTDPAFAYRHFVGTSG